MKIALLHLGRRGAGPVFAFEMAKALTAEGHHVLSFVSAYAENYDNWIHSGLNVIFIKTYKTRIQLIFSFFSIKRFSYIINKIKDFGPDVVYSPMGHMWDFILMPLLRNYTRIKTIHDVELHEGENSFIRKLTQRINEKMADGYVVLSSKYVSVLNMRGIPLEAIVVIPHAGLDYYMDDNQSIEYNNIILFFGRIQKYKGLDILLDAMKIVKTKNDKIKLRIVGNGDISSFNKKINDLGDTVELHNRWIKDEDVAGFVYDVLVVVLPYTHASQSGVIPLAYSFSKPVISTDVGCLSEQVKDGVTGFLIEPNNAQLLADSILTMFENREKTITMGLMAYKYAKNELTWQASARKLIKFVNELKMYNSQKTMRYKS